MTARTRLLALIKAVVCLMVASPDDVLLAADAAHGAEKRAETASPCTLRIEGLMRQPSTDPVNEATLLEALTGLTVTREFTYTEGEPVPLFRVRCDGAALLDIVTASGGGLHALVIRDAHMARELGHDLGSGYSDWVRARLAVICTPGVEELSGAVLCQERARPDLRLRFDGEWQGPDGALPPADVLAGWTLHELIWLPGADLP